jgi:hypothetical protein
VSSAGTGIVVVTKVLYGGSLVLLYVCTIRYLRSRKSELKNRLGSSDSSDKIELVPR